MVICRDGYVPDSKFAGQMNVMCRRNEIIDDLRTQYLYLIGSLLADDNISGSILSDYGGEVQELKEFCFPGNEVTFPEKIVLKGFFDIKKLAAASFEDEKIQGYLMIMDTVCYDGLWYGLEPGGTFARPSGMYYGVAAVDSLIGEKGMDLLYCSVIEPEGLTE